MKMEFNTSRKRLFTVIVIVFFTCSFSFINNIASASPSAGATGDPKPFSLPLVLLSYDISMNNKKVFINWVTGEEKKISHFVIERSTNGVNYIETGIVSAVGNSAVKQNYNYNETLSASAGVVYYRLKMVDTYGHYQNSQVRLVRTGWEANATVQLQAFPNPAINQIAVTVPAKWQSKRVEFYIYNVSGHVVKHIMNGKASQTETLDLRGLEKGTYIVKASTEAESVIQRILKL